MQVLRGRWLRLRHDFGRKARVSPSARLRKPGTIRVGDNVIISEHAVICQGVVIGDNVYIGPYSFIDDDVHLESGVSVSTHCSLLTRSHDHSDPRHRAGTIIMERKLVVGRGAWIGTYAIVLSRVGRVGAGAIVGAGSVVTREVSDNSVVAGNPARQLRTLPA